MLNTNRINVTLCRFSSKAVLFSLTINHFIKFNSRVTWNLGTMVIFHGTYLAKDYLQWNLINKYQFNYENSLTQHLSKYFSIVAIIRGPKVFGLRKHFGLIQCTEEMVQKMFSKSLHNGSIWEAPVSQLLSKTPISNSWRSQNNIWHVNKQWF